MGILDVRLNQTCQKCGKLVWFSTEKKVQVKVDHLGLSRFGVPNSYWYHESCYLKDIIESKDEQIKDLKVQLDKFDRLNLSMVVDALRFSQEKGIEPLKITLSNRIYNNLLKQIDFRQSVVFDPPITKKIGSIFGMAIKVDPEIEGWYIKKK